MDRVRATFQAEQMSFDKYLDICDLKTTIKANSTIHRTMRYISRRLWNLYSAVHNQPPRRSKYLNQCRMFGEYGFIHFVHRIKKKGAYRLQLVATFIIRWSGAPAGDSKTCSNYVDQRGYYSHNKHRSIETVWKAEICGPNSTRCNWSITTEDEKSQPRTENQSGTILNKKSEK